MVIGILQPGYLPWLGFFEQLYRSDAFVIYDDVQYDKHGWRNRNRIKTPNGSLWLTVPVITSLSEKTPTKDIRIDNKHNWARKHLLSIQQGYAKAPFSGQYMDLFEQAYTRQWEYLIDLDMHFILMLAECLGIDNKKIVRSSSLCVEGDKVGRLVGLCKHLGADTFYEGASGRNYIDEAYFARCGITVEFQEYRHPVYNQLHGDFLPYQSVIDLLFNHGSESLSILLNQK